MVSTVKIYTSSPCGFCHVVKHILTEKGVAFTEFDVWAEPEKKQEMVQHANGGRTVPQIFIDNVCVGGCGELYAVERAGKLDGLLSR